MGGRRRLSDPGDWLPRFKRVGSQLRQIRADSPETRTRAPKGAKSLMPDFLEKPLSFRWQATVPQTNTGGQGENPKAYERTRVKEFGKMAP